MPRLPLRRHRPPVGGAEVVAGSVTTLELFFDLVFVFTITQLTAALGADRGWAGLGRTVLLLVLMWWMYGGYAWLTNAVPPVTPLRRGFLLLGMGGNFVMALAVPHAFTTDRVVFASGYAVVVVVHTAMYLTQSSKVTGGMVVQLLLSNVLATLLIVVGAVVGGPWLYVLWVLAIATETLLPRLAMRTPLRHMDNGPAFQLQPAHFVERHGLMLIIVLGESVLAIGVGVSSGVTTIGLAQIGFVAVSLALAATLYWAYFGTHQDEAAERALESVAPERQQGVALLSFGYAFAAVLLGIVLIASGLHDALQHPTSTIPVTSAAHLAGGVALAWVGLSLFGSGIGRPAPARLVGGVVLGAATLLGTAVSGLVELVVLLAGSVLILVLERRRPSRS